MSTAVVIPARDEAGSIAWVVSGARAELPAARVIVVDDASHDGTGGLAASAGANVVSLQRHAGYAGALRAGYRAAIHHGAEAILQLDGDGQHDPSDLPRILGLLSDHDVVLGSRFLDPRSYRPSVARRAGIAACRSMAAHVGGLHVTDPTSGYRGLRASVAARIADQGFPHGLTETSLLIALYRSGVRVCETPVCMAPPRGRSMHRGLAGGAHFLRISLAVLALAADRQPR